MMTENLHIRNLKARYRLTRPALGVRQRLDGLLREMMGEALEAALEQAGIPAHEEVCVREVHAPVRLRLSDSDETLIRQWSEALASYIRRAIDEGGSRQVVRYPARINGYVDFAAGVALDCLNRAWAWNQLGIASLSEGASRREALEQLLTAFEREPHFIVPVLRSLARQGRLQAFAARLDEESWRFLARAAAAAAGVGGVLQSDFGAPSNEETGAIASTAMPQASLLLNASSLARLLFDNPRAFARPRLPLESLTALVALEVDPTLLRRRQWSSGLLQRIAHELVARHGIVPGLETFVADRDRRAITDADEGRSFLEQLSKYEKKRGRLCDGDAAKPLDERYRNDFADNIELNTPPRHVSAAGSTVRKPETGAKEGDEIESLHMLEVIDDYPPPVLNEHRETGYGGVLFLLTLVDALELPEAIIAASCFELRPFKWVLHRLALNLLPLKFDDAALMAFCGVGHEEKLPWLNEPEPDEAELKWFEESAAALVALLRERLGEHDIGRELLLDRVCRRQALIVCDPGWLEAIFSIESVSTDIRRAALDLDPGYLPWLGQVVRFRYE